MKNFKNGIKLKNLNGIPCFEDDTVKEIVIIDDLSQLETADIFAEGQHLIEKDEIWAFNDGYSDVGWIATCKNCGKDNVFVSEGHKCKYCEKEFEFTKEAIKHMDEN